ncbi:hypothetical protein DFH06DRAFT_1130919 [Mycena polygramma]|nr:hypothetical protein DFH06DRAFT_1130919 [Mycena polygramma]
MNPRPYSPPPVPGDIQHGETVQVTFTADEIEIPGVAPPRLTDEIHPTIHDGETLLLEGELGSHWEVEKKINEHGDYSLISIKQSWHRFITILTVRHEWVAMHQLITDTPKKRQRKRRTAETGEPPKKLPRSARNMRNNKVPLPYWVDNLNPTNYHGQRYYQ